MPGRSLHHGKEHKILKCDCCGVGPDCAKLWPSKASLQVDDLIDVATSKRAFAKKFKEGSWSYAMFC